jgi:hypothetical protein
MCAACNGTKRISGRVDHVRWAGDPARDDSATHLTPQECWVEGDDIDCPYCLPGLYGDIKRIELRAKPLWVADPWVEFSGLVEAWKRETSLSSSTRRKYASEHYRKIIGMGRKAVPLIVRQIELEGATPYHWWDALRELTGHDPVPPEAGGDIRSVARCWIEWARQQEAEK